MAQKGLWNLARNKALQDRGALPEDEGDTIREYKAMHEENFLSSWWREDGKGTTKGEMEVDQEVREDVGTVGDTKVTLHDFIFGNDYQIT